jgi:phage/plasmid-like protein (TIGR03299 family)
MSHEIVNNMLAYTGEKPWHGLGVEVPVGTTGEEMLKLAKLDFNVVTRAVAIRVGRTTVAAPQFRAITREDTNDVFQIASKRWSPVQNKDIVDFFKEFCEAGHATMETVGGLFGGRVVWAQAKLNGGSKDEIGPGDKVEGRLLMYTSHDGQLRTGGRAVQTRAVCWNTLRAALGEKTKQEFTFKHTKKWTPALAEEARKIMGMAIEQVVTLNQISKELSHVTIDEQGRLEFVLRLLGGESLVDQIVSQSDASLLDQIAASDELGKDINKAMGRVGKAILEAIVDSPGSDLPSAQGTMWGAVNGVSYFTDHVRGRIQDNRLQEAWFGGGSNLKAKAITTALQMSGLKLAA